LNFLNKIFGSKKKEATTIEAPSKYMPEIKIPVDELFTINFKKNGGKFLYCETVDEAFDILKHILKENHWDETPLISLEPGVQNLLQQQGYKTTDKVNKDGILFTPCEHLIAQNGSILVSDVQFIEYKLHQLPELIIVYATTSQLTETIQDGLKQIKKNYPQIPGNITAIKNFQKTPEAQKDFLSYGSSNKDIYLILLENL